MRLEIGTHALQRLDVAPQLRQLAELELDLLLAGLHVLPRLGELALQLGAAAPATGPALSRISSSVRCINAWSRVSALTLL